MKENTSIENRALKVLILEDSLQDMELMVAQLSAAGYQLDVTHTVGETSFTNALTNNSYDIILSDFKLPDFDAFGALELCLKYCPDTPFICVSGSIGEELAIKLLKKGALDYVLKDRPQRLPYAIKNALAEVKEKSDRILAFRKLEESENRFRQVAETAQEWIWEVDTNGMYIYASPMIETLLGYSPDEVVGKKYFYDFIVPEKMEGIKKVAFELFEKKEVFRNYENTNVHRNGNLVIVSTSASPIFDESGNFTGYRGVDEDITERKKLMEELVVAKEKAEESEQNIRKQKNEIELNNARLESLLKVSQYQTDSVQELLDLALIQAVDLTKSKIGYIYFYNEDKEQFTLNTWSKEVMKECSVLNPQTVYNLDQTGCWGEAVRQRKPILINDFQAENPQKNGIPEGHVKLENFLTIPVIFDKRIVAVAGVANKSTDYNDTDIRQLTLLMDSVWKMTERLILIRDLLEAKEKAEESDRLKSAFLANMSHEIRTPMNGILGFTDLLLTPDLSSEEKDNYIKIVQKSGMRMLSTVNDIIEISKIEAGLVKVSINETNFNERVEELYRFFVPEAEKKGLLFSLEKLLPKGKEIILTDINKLDSILSNLIKNAIKYTETGTIKIGCHIKNSLIEFYVKDTGIGIPKARQEAIFNRFEQADIADTRALQGAGLGLAIAKSYVEMLNGKIWVESKEASGSTFLFSFPVILNTERNITLPDSSENDAKPTNKLISGLKILVVEDDEASELLISIELKKFSRELLKARSGYEAIDTCRKNSDIDLVLMDILIPDLNGYEATCEIRNFNKKVIIIAQTAYALTGDREKAIEAGCNEYISKPIHKAELQALIHKHFGK